MVDTLTGLTKGIRAHQVQEDENNRISVKQALDTASERMKNLAVRSIPFTVENAAHHTHYLPLFTLTLTATQSLICPHPGSGGCCQLCIGQC